MLKNHKAEEALPIVGYWVVGPRVLCVRFGLSVLGSGFRFRASGFGAGGGVWNVGFSAEVMLAYVALFTVVEGLTILMLSL